MEIENYAQIIQRIYETNPKNLLSVQIYSVARPVAENTVQPLPVEFLENVKKKVQEKNSNLTVEIF